MLFLGSKIFDLFRAVWLTYRSRNLYFFDLFRDLRVDFTARNNVELVDDAYGRCFCSASYRVVLAREILKFLDIFRD